MGHFQIPVRHFSLSIFGVFAAISVQADDDVESSEPPKQIQSSQCVDLFQFTANLSRFHELASKLKQEFPRLESEFLFDIASAFDADKLASSGHTSFGQKYGVYFPEEDYYVGLVLPLNAGELVDDEDYSLGEDDAGYVTMGGHRAEKTEHYFGLTLSADSDEKLIFPQQETRSFIDFVVENESKLATIDLTPAKVGRSPLKKQLMTYQIELATEAQQRDDEADYEYSWRALYSKHLAKLFQMFFRDVERLAVNFQSGAPRQPLSFEIRLECRRKSDLLAFFQEMKSKRNRSLSWLHSSATSFATWRAILPAEFRKQLSSAGQQTAKALQSAGESQSVASQVQNSMVQLAEYGAVELLLQLVPLSETSESLVLVVPLGMSTRVDGELIQLISGSDDLQATIELDGWPVYPVGDLLGVSDSTWMTVTDAALIFATSQDEDQQKTMDLMLEIIRKEFSPSPSAAVLSNAFAAVRTSTLDIIRLADGAPEFASQYLPNGVELSDDGRLPEFDQDAIQMTCGLDGNEVFVNCTFESNALAIGVTASEWLVSGCFALFSAL